MPRKQPDTFAARLRALREKAGVSMSDLAERSGVSYVAVTKFETGERQPRWDSVCKLAAALGVSTEAFR